MATDDLAAIFADVIPATPKTGNGGGFTVEELRATIAAGYIDPEKSLPKDGDGMRRWARFVVAMDPVDRELAISNKYNVLCAMHENAMGIIDAALLEASRERMNDLDETTDGGPFLDWSTFWVEDEDPEWVYEDVLAWGRGHALYATHKAGKSLLALYIAAKVATTTEHRVVYVDYEMTERDVRERLQEMGYGPESDLSRLHYALLPKLPPLDTEHGGAALMDLLDLAATDHPDAHFVVVIDTISRAVAGEENSADTWRFFYLYTGMRLKQRGCTWMRLDHSGKDAERGQRGSSGKGDDVDIVWKLTASQNGVVLKRELCRMNSVPERVTLIKREDPYLHYIRATHDEPAGTLETVEALDAIGVPLTASNAQARRALREAGKGARNDVIAASLRWRRMAFPESGERSPAFPTGNGVGNASNTTQSSLGNTSGNSGERDRRPTGEQFPPRSGEQSPGPGSATSGTADGFDF